MGEGLDSMFEMYKYWMELAIPSRPCAAYLRPIDMVRNISDIKKWRQI
jgi:hypothetical protein